MSAVLEDGTSLLDDVRQRLRSLYVHTPEHGYALKELKDCIERYQKHKEPSGFILTGESHAGKTTTIKQLDTWARVRYPSSHPFLLVSTPADASPRALAASILAACDDPFAWRSKTKSDREGRVYGMVRELDPTAIIFDEFQNLFVGKTRRQIIIASQSIKNYYNDFKRPIIVAGLSSITQSITASDELKNRFCRFASLPKYRLVNPKDLRAFRNFLCAVAEITPFESEVQVEDDNMLTRLLLASDGIVGDVINLCISACEVAKDDGRVRVSLSHLATAFTKRLENIDLMNPFLLDNYKIRKMAEAMLKKHQRDQDRREGQR